MSSEIVIDNLLIKYSKAGEPGGRAVLFLHGWRSNKEIWREVIEKYNNRKIEKYTIDFPGFGGSQMPSRTFSVSDYVEVVKGFIEKLDLKNVMVVGHSFGGRVGIKLAAKYPSAIAKLVLVDSAGFATGLKRKNLYQSLAKVVKPFFKPRFMQGLRKKIYRQIGAEDYLATPELQSTFVKITGEDLAEDMKKITCPTLIVYGENDKDTPAAFGHKMNALIPGSKYLIIKDAGHFSFLDRPGEFAKILADFI